MNRNLRALAVVAVAAIYGAASAQNLMETFSVPAGEPNTIFGSGSTGPTYAGTFGTFSSVGGYQLGKITIEGNIRRNQSTTGDAPNDNRLALWKPGTTTGSATHRVDTTTSSWGSVTIGNTGFFTGTLTLGTAFDPAGSWTRQLFNWFDDAPTATNDSWYEDMTVKFYDNNIAAPSSQDLGAFNVLGDFNSDTATYAASGIKWYKFTTTGTSANLGLRLHTYTDNAVGTPIISDTEFGVYSSAGTLLYSNDDASSVAGSNYPTGQGARSYGQFGAGGGAGNLAAGTYYVAVGAFNSSFSNGFVATSASSSTGNIRLSVQAVPEPATMAAISLGLAAIARRKRK